MTEEHGNKVAVVTGSTKGIGRSIARELATSGFSVVVTSRQAADAKEAAEDIKALGGEALGVEFNLEQRGGARDLVTSTIDYFGRLDVLVNNALSISGALPADVLSDEQIEEAFTSNITHTFLLARAAHPYLREKGGCVINIGSAVANRQLLGLPVYGIIKGAIVQMTKALSAEWAPGGVRVNAINPGFIRTNAFAAMGMPEDVVENSYAFYETYHPLGRIGEPSDVGKLAAYLASEAGGLITGAVIDVDGGYSTRGLPVYAGR